MVACISIMAVFSDTFLVLGAIFGFATVYLAPYSISKDTSKNISTIIIPDIASPLRNNHATSKIYGDTTINDVLSMIKIEISKLLRAEKWTIIVPKQKNLDFSPDYFDARSQFITPKSDIHLDLTDIPDDCTEYKDIPDRLFSGSSKKKKTKKNQHKFYSGMKCLGISIDNPYQTRLPRQSTFLSTNSKNYPKYVLLGENTIEELQTFAEDSDYSIITVENDNIEFSLKKSKSPINRLFHGVRSFLGFKRSLHKENNNIKNYTQ